VPLALTTVNIPVQAHDKENCTACTDRFQAQLRTHPGIVKVTDSDTQFRVTYDSKLCAQPCLDQAIHEIRRDLTQRFQHEVLSISGMDCPDCAQTIERAVRRINGVAHCSVIFTGAKMRVEVEGSPTTVAQVRPQVRRCVRNLGYRVRTAPSERTDNSEGTAPSERTDKDTTDEDPLASSWYDRLPEILVTIMSGVGVLTATLLSLTTDSSLLPEFLYSLAILLGGYSIARSGWSALWATRRPDINLLMSIAVVGAVGIGAWQEAALVVLLFRIGENLESQAAARTRRSLETLVTLAPATAQIQIPATDTPHREFVEKQVPVHTLVVGDKVVVRPGEPIPVDGIVLDGASAVDQSPITGEAMPVDKTAGDTVFAGTHNSEGRLLIRVSTAPGDTTLDRITAAVQEAQAQQAPTQRWVNRFAEVYTPLVIFVAVLTISLPPLAGWGAFSAWLYRGLAFLILACPCALVIATPVAIVSALGRACTAGVLVKGGAHLENAARLRVMAFDKTGTLTQGQPRVVEVIPLAAPDARTLLSLAAALEEGSEHPLAHAVRDAARAQEVPHLAVHDFQAERGFGVRGTIAGRMLRAAAPRLFATHPGFNTPPNNVPDSTNNTVRAGKGAVIDPVIDSIIDPVVDPVIGNGAIAKKHTAPPQPAQDPTTPRKTGATPQQIVERLKAQGHTIIVIGDDTTIDGVLALADTPRPHARPQIAALRAVGISHITLLTGDHAAAAQATAAQLGIRDVRSDLLPDDKVSAIQELQAEFGPTGMVGDGVNDAPALAVATVGLAMGSAGSPAAIETADIALMGDDPGKVAGFLGLARWTNTIVRQNIIFALTVKIIAALLNLFGLLPLWAAVLTDVGTTLIVVANGLRLLRGRPVGKRRHTPLLEAGSPVPLS